MDSRDPVRAVGLFLSAATASLTPIVSLVAFAGVLLRSSTERAVPAARPTLALALTLTISLASTRGGIDDLVAAGWWIAAVALLPLWAARARPGDAGPLLGGIAVAMAVHGTLAVVDVGGGAARAATVTGHPNFLGAFAALSTVALLGGLLLGRDERPRAPWLLLGASSGALALALSGSRGALAAAAVGALLVLIVHLRTTRSPGKPAIALLAVAVVVAAALVFGVDRTRWLDLGGVTDPAGRPTLWSVGLEIVAARPVLGNGVEAWQRLAPRYEPSILPHRIRHPHSSYLQIALERGLLSLAAFLVWSTAITIDLARRRSVAAGLGLAVLATFLVHNAFETFLDHTGILLLAWLVIGLGATEFRVPSETSTEVDGKRASPAP